jgi:hypothetical protein
MVLFTSLVLGCENLALQWVPLSPPPHPVASKPAQQVELFTAHAPTRAYEEVGIIQVQRSGYAETSPGELLERLRSEAGMHGCDGLVITGYNAVGDRWATTGYRGTCVVYTLADHED